MNAKKKLFSIGLAASLAAIVVAGSSLAYFTAEVDKKNVYTVGNVSIVLNEENWEDTGKNEAQDMYPGQAVAKDPTVTNDGKNPALVRVKVEGMENFTYRTTNGEAGTLGEGWVYNEEDKYFYYNGVLAVGATTDALFDQIVLKTTATNETEGGSVIVTAQAIQAQGAVENIDEITLEKIIEWFGNFSA